VTEVRRPLSTGTDAGTTVTVDYTVATQPAPNATCGGKPEWAGLVCRTYPAAQPVGQPLPDRVIAAYSMRLRPVTQVETGGAAIRTTTDATAGLTLMERFK
jgi:hypothetical protein